MSETEDKKNKVAHEKENTTGVHTLDLAVPRRLSATASADKPEVPPPRCKEEDTPKTRAMMLVSAPAMPVNASFLACSIGSGYIWIR